MRKLINLGCKLNQYEGYCLLAAFPDVNDLVIVNTCCVTREAEVNSQKKFRQAVRQHPGAMIIATGCACRTDPGKFQQAMYVIDNVDRNTAIQNVMPRPDRSRYFLKIEDGCDMACTYCIVALVRQRVESRSAEDIGNEVRWASSLGYKEIVLVGANIGLYGRASATSLEELLLELSSIPDCPRIRLSSIEPFLIKPGLVETMARTNACRHFHIPIQSADDTILKRMRRPYDREHLARTIEMIRGRFEDVAIGTDIIVGFPGEGEKEFMNTYRFIEEQPFTHLHVFPYSPRPGTEAYALGDPVPKQEKKDRLWELRKLIAQKNHAFRRTLIGKTFKVTVERKEERCFGLTDNYIKVDLEGTCAEREMIEAKIDRVIEDETHAVPVHKAAIMP